MHYAHLYLQLLVNVLFPFQVPIIVVLADHLHRAHHVLDHLGDQVHILVVHAVPAAVHLNLGLHQFPEDMDRRVSWTDVE